MPRGNRKVLTGVWPEAAGVSRHCQLLLSCQTLNKASLLTVSLKSPKCWLPSCPRGAVDDKIEVWIPEGPECNIRSTHYLREESFSGRKHDLKECSKGAFDQSGKDPLLGKNDFPEEQAGVGLDRLQQPCGAAGVNLTASSGVGAAWAISDHRIIVRRLGGGLLLCSCIWGPRAGRHALAAHAQCTVEMARKG